MSTYCRSTAPAGPGRWWRCTELAKHRGDHKARDLTGTVVHRWKRGSRQKAAAR